MKRYSMLNGAARLREIILAHPLIYKVDMTNCQQCGSVRYDISYKLDEEQEETSSRSLIFLLEHFHQTDESKLDILSTQILSNLVLPQVDSLH